MVFTVYAFNGVSLFCLVRGNHLEFLYDLALVNIIWIMRNAVRAYCSLLIIKIRPLVMNQLAVWQGLCLVEGTLCYFLQLSFEEIQIMKYFIIGTASNGW